MEWVVPWRKGGGSERRTAVVQLCDKHMILVIQVSEMKRTPLDSMSLPFVLHTAQGSRRT